jgi:hypothetical protein
MTRSRSAETPGTAGVVRKVRSLPIDLWPAADRDAFTAACQRAVRLKRGGRAAHLKPITQKDLARRYGYFLDYMDRQGKLDVGAAGGSHVTPANVGPFLAELQARVGSVTTYGTIYKVRRATELIAPGVDVRWLVEVEKDLDAVKEPRSKAARVVLTQVLVEAALTLIAGAEANPQLGKFRRAVLVRNGLMIGLLAFHPIRNKNFTVLKIGKTFKRIKNEWWVILDYSETKEDRDDERRVNDMLASAIDRYLTVHRPLLARGKEESYALWISANDGEPMTEDGVAKALSSTTLAGVGIAASPHLFRTAGSSTAAIYGHANPYLGGALLNHRGATVNQMSYNWATSVSAAKALARVLESTRGTDEGGADVSP